MNINRTILFAIAAAVLGLVVSLGSQAQVPGSSVTGFINATSDDCSTAGSCVQLNGLALSFQSATISCTGNGLGNYLFEGTSNGTDWSPLQGVRVGAISALARRPVNGAPAAGVWNVEAAGLTAIRVRGKQIIRPDIAVTIQMSTAPFRP